VEPTTAFKESAQWVGVPMDGYFKILPNGTYEDEWGIRYELTSDRLHWRYIYHPLATAESPNEIELPSLDAPGRFDTAVKTVKAMREEYVIEAFPFVTLYETGWALRGFNRFNLDLIQNSAFIEKLLDKLLKLILEMVARFVEAGADVIQLGDDFGMQTSMLVSPTLWRRFFKPRMKIVVDGIKKTDYYDWSADGVFDVCANIDGLSIRNVRFNYVPGEPDMLARYLVSVGPKWGTLARGGGWIEVFNPNANPVLQGLRIEGVVLPRPAVPGACVAGDAVAELVHERCLSLNPDFPRTMPRGGTGRGQIRRAVLPPAGGGEEVIGEW